MKKLLLILPLIPKLGFWNVAYAAWYKATMRLGLRKKYFPKGEKVKGDFFKKCNVAQDYPLEWKSKLITAAEEIYNGTFTYFSHHKFELSSVPNWFYNPFDEKIHSQSNKHWTEISDFGEGDIKVIWELSRFDWLTTLARAYKVTGDDKYLVRINALLNDWSEKNPLNQGPNWKCGQEASFRLMKLLTTAHILDQLDQPTDQLRSLIQDHSRRIYPNIRYALVQENNHSTSECIGVYIAAVWFTKVGYENDLSDTIRESRSRLERSIKKLVLPQGTFAQLSTNYHRVFLDTMSFCLSMMNLHNQETFDTEIIERLEKAGEWQYKMTFGERGEVPNFGSNDGAMIENLHNCDYRDFRPSVQLFLGILNAKRVFDSIDSCEPMYWRLGKESIYYQLHKIDLKSEILDKQIAILRFSNHVAFIKVPGTTFRQSNDAFHIDLWSNGEAVLVDTGTYSYNAGEKSEAYKSTKAHNTAYIDSQEQLPKIGRFLNGAWIRPKVSELIINETAVLWNGIMTTNSGALHHREVALDKYKLSIKDSFDHHNNAIIYYHFPQNRKVNYEIVHGKESSSNVEQIKESKYYMQEQGLTSISIEPTDNYVSFTIYFDKNKSKSLVQVNTVTSSTL